MAAIAQQRARGCASCSSSQAWKNCNSVLFVFVWLFIVSISNRVNAETYSGFARLTTTQNGTNDFLQGWIKFDQTEVDKVTVTVYAEGSFPDGEYALVVHQYGDMTNRVTGASFGPHYHAGNNDHDDCVGDLGSFDSTEGVISATRVFNVDDHISLRPPHEVIGRGIALYRGPKKCDDDNGNRVAMMAMGVIGISNVPRNKAMHQTPETNKAVAVLFPTDKCPGCSGTVWLTVNAGLATMIEAQVFGLPAATIHGVHIHTYGDLSGDPGDKIGDHLNPNNTLHALPPTQPRHVGDLGNINSFSVKTGSKWYSYETRNIKQVEFVLGRAFVVGSNPDHGIGPQCGQDGNTGAPLLIGVIGIANPTTTAPPLPSDVHPPTIWNNLKCTTVDPNVPNPDDGSNAGLWSIVIILVITLLFIGLVALYCWYSRSARAGYEELK